MKRVAKIAGISLAVLLILLVAAYLFVSSSFFVRRIALPMVSAKTGWSITAGRARFSPFRSLILNDVVATPPEDGLAMVATEVECRYSAMRILRGKPTVHTLHIADATLHASQTAPAPGRAAFDLTLDGLQLTLHSVAPGAQATFEVTSDVRLTGPDLDVPRGRLSGKGTVTLGPDARPTHAQADIDLDRLAGRLRDLDLAQHALTIHAAIRSEAPLWRVDELVADITQAGALAARLTATGTVGQNPATADLSLAASPVTAGFLDLLGGLGGGYRFGQTALEYAGRLQLAADAAVTTDGTLALRELTVRSPDGKLPELPPVGVSFRHQASYSKAEGRLSVQALDAQIEQGGAEVLRLKASEPFTLVAGGSAPGTAAAGTPVQIRLDAKDFPLALISPLLPSSAGVTIGGGTLSGTVAVTAGDNGRALQVTGNLTEGQVAVSGKGLHVENLTLTHSFRAALAELASLDVQECVTRIALAGQDVGRIALTGPFDLKTRQGEPHADIELQPGLLNVAGATLGGYDLGRTAARFSGSLRLGPNGDMSSQGNLDLTELTVRAPALRLPELPPQAVTVRYQVAYAPQAKRLTATELDARVLQADGAERLRLRLTRPLQLSADGTVATPPGEELPEVQLDVNGMPLALVNAFLPADTAARIESGTLHGTLKATLQPDGKTLAVAGSLAEKDVRVALGTQPLDALSATHDINLTLANLRDLKIAEFATGFTLAQQPAGQIALLGDLNLQTLAGRQTVNLQAPSALLDFIGRLAGGYRVGQGAVVYAGTVTLASAGELAAQGELTLKGLTVNHPSRRLPALPPLDGTVRHQAAFNKERKLLILSELDARLAQGVAEMLRLELSRPVRVDLAHGVQVAAAEGGAVELQLALTNLPLALANPVIPAAKGIHFDSGTASGQLSLGLKADSKTLYAKGRLGEANLALTARDKTYGPATLTHDLDIEFADSAKLTLTTCTTDLLVGERPAGRIALSGTLDLKAGAGRQDLTVTGLSHEVLAALPLTLPDGITVQKLLLDARLEASQADGFKTVSANGQLTIPQVVAAHAETGTLPATKADCTFSGQYRPDGVRLDALTVRAEGDGTLLADLAAKGQLPLPLAAGQGRIDVTSQGANLEVVAGIAKVFAGGRKTAPREDKPAPADRPSTLNDLKLVGTLDAKALSFRNVLVSKAAGTVTLDKGVVTVKPLDLVVNESPVSLTATVDLGTPGYAYEVQGTVANLDLAPYLRSFAPPMVNSQVSGHIASVRTEFKGSGLTLARLSETLAGTAQVKGDSLVVRNVPAFDAFADEWELPELQRQSFDTVALDLRAADGLVSIQQGLVRGADLRLDAEGAMRVADLALDVLAKAAVGGALEKRLIQKGLGTGFVRFDETHRRLPTAIPITGTLLKPETRFDFGRLLKETAKSVGAGVLNQVLDDAAQGKKIDARSILEGVFKPASTEPETAPTPEATPQQPATPATPATPTTDKPSTTRPAGGLPGLILPRLAKPAETTPAPATPANKPADEPAPRPAPVIVIPKIR